MGARVPLREAIVIFRLAIRCRERREICIPVSVVRVGDFKLDHIEADGTIHAGCHVIHWEESARLAADLGLIPHEPEALAYRPDFPRMSEVASVVQRLEPATV